jgi:hypothetical protein
MLTKLEGIVVFCTVTLWMLGSVYAEECSSSDIRILQADHHPPDGMLAHVVGELINGCGNATGVPVRVTLRLQNGKVITNQKVWSASITNIPAHRSFPFEFPIAEVRQDPPPTMQVVVEEAQKW